MLNAAAPIAAAIVGTLIIGTWADRITKQAQQRRDDHRLREELIGQVTEAVARLYLETQRYWRARRDGVSGDGLAAHREDLDRQYQLSRVEGYVLENRLMAYFTSDEPKLLCHRLMDLLTVRYFQLIDRATESLLWANAGEQHSGLTVSELRNPKLLLDAYHETLRHLAQAILVEPLAFE